MIRIFFNTISFIFFLFIVSFECTARPALLSVMAPKYAGQTISIRGFDVFHSEILDSLVFDPQGKAFCSLQYSGFALLEANEDDHYPVILGYGDLFLEINADSHVIVGNGNMENRFFYRNLRQLVSLLSQKSELKRSLAKSGNEAIIGQDLRYKIFNLDVLLANFSQMLNDSSNYFSSRLLQARLLLDSSSNCRDTNYIKHNKDILLGFILSNMEVLRHSDILQKVALRYMAMNDWVPYTTEQYNRHFIEDIHEWITSLDKLVTREEVINQFLTMALNIYYVTPAGALLESFPKEVLCPSTVKRKVTSSPMPDVLFGAWGYPADKYRMSSFKGITLLLIFVDPGCNASVPAHVMVTRYLKENKIELPFLTVFNTSSPEKLSKWLPSIGLYCDTNLDPEMTLASYSAIEHFPAFVILDGNFRVVDKFYTLQEIEGFLCTLIRERD